MAGCLRLSPDGGSSPTDEAPTAAPETATATPSPTTTFPADSTPTYPSGLSADGVTAFLYPTHVKTLAATSYRTRWTKLDRRDSVLKWQKQYRADPQGAFGTWTRTEGGPVEIYRYPGGGYWRESLGDRVTFGDDGAHRWSRVANWAVELAPLLRAIAWSAPTRVNEERPAVWELTGTGIAEASAVPGHHEPGEVLAVDSASLTVDERGIIRSVTADYRLREGKDGEEFSYAIEFNVDSIGAVSVPEPSWLATAKEQVPTVTASLTDDRRFVRVRIESGNRLEPNSRISVFDAERDAKFIVPLDAPVEPGQPAYLYTATPEAAFSMGDIARESPPSDVSAGQLSSTYELAAFRRDTRYFDRIDVA